MEFCGNLASYCYSRAEIILQYLCQCRKFVNNAIDHRRVIWLGLLAFLIRNITVAKTVGAPKVHEKTTQSLEFCGNLVSY